MCECVRVCVCSCVCVCVHVSVCVREREAGLARTVFRVRTTSECAAVFQTSDEIEPAVDPAVRLNQRSLNNVLRHFGIGSWDVM